jgi:hypothetical protein
VSHEKPNSIRLDLILTKGEKAGLLTSEVQKYGEVQRSTKKYKEVQRSTEKYREVQRSTGKYREVHGSTEKYHSFFSFFSQKQSKNVLLLGNVKNSVPTNRTFFFCHWK